jgi:hypothetical protein
MFHLILISLFTYVKAHGFLSLPVARNTIGKQDFGICTWLGSPPCFGDYMSLGSIDGPDPTGCTNKPGTGQVTGNLPLSYKQTKYINE